MSRHFYCANCGKELAIARKVDKSKPNRPIIDVVEPHYCMQEIPPIPETAAGEKELKLHNEANKIVEEIAGVIPEKSEPKKFKTAKELLNDFPFVKNLNKASTSEVELSQQLKDKRPARNEIVTNTAPLAVRDMMQANIGKPPANSGKAYGEPGLPPNTEGEYNSNDTEDDGEVDA